MNRTLCKQQPLIFNQMTIAYSQLDYLPTELPVTEIKWLIGNNIAGTLSFLLQEFSRNYSLLINSEYFMTFKKKKPWKLNEYGVAVPNGHHKTPMEEFNMINM
eukprot:203890_1